METFLPDEHGSRRPPRPPRGLWWRLERVLRAAVDRFGQAGLLLLAGLATILLGNLARLVLPSLAPFLGLLAAGLLIAAFSLAYRQHRTVLRPLWRGQPLTLEGPRLWERLLRAWQRWRWRRRW
jgi:hypothetical protein